MTNGAKGKKVKSPPQAREQVEVRRATASMSSAPTQNPASSPRRITSADIHFSELMPVIDVVYGAVLSYGFYLIADNLRPLITGQKVPWPAVLLLAFTTNYLVGDYVEARLYTKACPYKGRARFSVDLIIPIGFFVSYIVAAAQSVGFLVAMAVIFALGGVWGILLDREYTGEVLCQYPRTICGTHFAAAILFASAAVEFHWEGRRELTVPLVLAIWVGYFLWCAAVVAAKEFLDIPRLEADLLPIFPVDVFSRRVVRWIRGK